jgi:hypothetical protein
MGQILLFEHGVTAGSTSPIGLRVSLPGACPRCNSTGAIIGSGSGPHIAKVVCDQCLSYRQWLPGETFKFIEDLIDEFGRPLEPIVVRPRGAS